MQSMTAAAFESVRAHDIHNPAFYESIALALKQREELLEARRLLMEGIDFTKPQPLYGPAGRMGFENGCTCALGWAQGLFQKEASHATNDGG